MVIKMDVQYKLPPTSNAFYINASSLWMCDGFVCFVLLDLPSFSDNEIVTYLWTSECERKIICSI